MEKNQILLNGVEVLKLQTFLNSIPEYGVAVELTQIQTEIGHKLLVKSGHCQKETDITDYDSW